MTIKVLGTGCKKCIELEKRVRLAVANLGLDAKVEKIEDLPSIMAYGAMMTPGIVIDEKLVSMGKLLSVRSLEVMINPL